LTVLPLMLAGRVRLLDNKTLRHQLRALERKPGDAAREQVNHPQHANAHDDVACACAGAIVATMPPADGSYSLQVWQQCFDPEALNPHEMIRRHQYADGTSAPLIPHDLRQQYERAAATPASPPVAPSPEQVRAVFAKLEAEKRGAPP
jgi:hypothetical protein